MTGLEYHRHRLISYDAFNCLSARFIYKWCDWGIKAAIGYDSSSSVLKYLQLIKLSRTLFQSINSKWDSFVLQIDSLEETLYKSMKNGNARFVEILLHYGVSLKSFLSNRKENLKRLYNNVRSLALNNTQFLQRDSEFDLSFKGNFV